MHEKCPWHERGANIQAIGDVIRGAVTHHQAEGTENNHRQKGLKQRPAQTGDGVLIAEMDVPAGQQQSEFPGLPDHPPRLLRNLLFRSDMDGSDSARWIGQS